MLAACMCFQLNISFAQTNGGPSAWWPRHAVVLLVHPWLDEIEQQTVTRPAMLRRRDREMREGRCVKLSVQWFLLNFSHYIIFITTSIFYSLLFHLPQQFSLNSSHISHYNHKISFHIHTFHLLLIFSFTNNWRRLTTTGVNNTRGSRYSHRERQGGHRLWGPCSGR